MFELDGGRGIRRAVSSKAQNERIAGVAKGGVLKSMDFE